MSGLEPIVSIITPTYNHERYIRHCIESAIAQTETRWEQIVVDDGSDDATEAIVRSIPDPRIRYVRREHRGIMHLAESYNVALALSRGAFIAILEGDDFWPADKIERQVPQFVRPEIVLSWGLAAITNEAGQFQETLPSAQVVASMHGQTQAQALRSLIQTNFVPACTVMARREALVRIGGFQQPEGIPTTDYPTWLELCRVGEFTCADETFGFHRKHESQVTVRMRSEMDLVLDWGTSFVEHLPVDERAALGVSVDEAHRLERRRHAYLDYVAGRKVLGADGDPAARPLFRRALRNGSRTTRLRASLGLACSYLGLDLERVVTMANRVLGR